MAHTFDAKLQIAASINNPVTGSFTCAAGATLLVVTLAYANGTRTGAPTYNGVSLTQLDQTRYAATSPEARCELWYLLDPPTGSSYTVSVPNPNTLSLEVVVSSYLAASGKRTVVDNATGTQNDNMGNPTTPISAADANGLLVGVIATGHDTWAPSGRLGTQLYDTDQGSWGSGHQYKILTAAGAYNMSWTNSGSDDLGIVAAAFSEAASGISVPKANIYAIEYAQGISVTKANVYAVLEAQPRVSQAPVEVIHGGDTPAVISQAPVEVIHGGDTPALMSQLVVEAIVSLSSTWEFAEIGSIAIDGEVDLTWEPAPEIQTWEFVEAGDIVLDGEVSIRSETAHDEAGDIVLDGEVEFDPIIPVDLKVTQTLGESLQTVQTELQVTQAQAEIAARFESELQLTQVLGEAFRRENSEIFVDQVLCEVLISGWRRTDFMPILARFF